MVASPGELLTYHLNHVLKTNLPAISLWNENLRPKLANSINSVADSVDGFIKVGHIDPSRSLVAGLVGGTYQFLCTLSDENQGVHPAFYLAVAMLLLTTFSWVSHWQRRGWSKKGLELPQTTASPTGPHSGPLSPPADTLAAPPLNVVPAD
jgi:hypothetical protein